MNLETVPISRVMLWFGYLVAFTVCTGVACSDGCGAGDPVKEWCGCGAAIRASKGEVVKWRSNHLHEGKPADEPQRQGAFSSSEIGPNYYMGEAPIEARIGFTPNV